MKQDEVLRNSVIEEVRIDPQLAKIATQINVTVKNEVVTLSGNVDYYGQKIAAERAAKRVKDVKVVAMDIVVESETVSDATSDSKLADAVRNALTWNKAVNEDLINIKVEEGWVYLDGIVNWEFERKAAEGAIENLAGVKGVINRVSVKERKVTPEDVKKKIKAAFHRHAIVDSANIQVMAHSGAVTLTGTVRSWTERKDAEDEVWSMPGVTNVENKLEVAHQAYVGE